MGQVEEGEEAYRRVQEQARLANWAQVNQLAQRLIEERTAYFGEAFDMRIRALSNMKELQRAVDVARSKSRIETDSSETDFLISKLYLSMGNVKVGRTFVNECAKLNPENRRCMALRGKLKSFESTLENAEKKMLLKDAADALEGLLATINRVPETEPYYDENFPGIFEGFRLPVLRLLCLKQAKRRVVEDAVRTCQEAKKLDTGNPEFYLVRLGELHLGREEYGQAMEYLQQARKISPQDQEVHDLLQKAEKMKASKMRTKHYDLLGVPKDASEDDIKKAYKTMVRSTHPDKQPDEASKAEAHKKMQEINNAYDVLSDKKKRAQYDAGFDPNDPNAGHSQGHGGFYQGGQSMNFNMDDLANIFQQQYGGHGFGGNRRYQNQNQQQRRRGHGHPFFHEDL